MIDQVFFCLAAFHQLSSEIFIENFLYVSVNEDQSRAHIFRVPTNFRQLLELHARLKTYRKQQQTILLKREYQRMQAAQREKMLESLEEDYKTEGKVNVILILRAR